MGRRFSDASVQADTKLWPFKVTADRGDKPMVAANSSQIPAAGAVGG
jgi:L1 cell adhesion molecule like protein